MSLILLDAGGKGKGCWNEINNWLSRYESIDLHAGSSDLMVETFESTMEYTTRVS